VDREALGHLGEDLADALERLGADGRFDIVEGLDVAGLVGSVERLAVVGAGLGLLGLGERGLQLRLVVLEGLGGFVVG
jgi:hypothetical protein